LFPRLADVCAQSRESSEFGGARADAVQVLLEKEKTEAAAIVGELTGLLEKQMAALDTFNVVLFGRTGTGKSSLVEALTNGDGARVSPMPFRTA
jgi:predicted GTPase